PVGDLLTFGRIDGRRPARYATRATSPHMQNRKEQVALSSVVASAGLTLAKGVIGAMTGSLAILSEAAHSLLDVVATVMTYFAVRISGKPADEEHQYG